MPRIERQSAVTWEGNLARGEGSLTALSTGAFSALPFSLPSRIAVTHGKTSPEELLAAAHGGCITRSRAGELTGAGFPPERLETTVNIVMDEVDGRHLVVASEVEVAARVAGIDQPAFDAAVQAADEGCSFSALIRASASVTVRARLEST
jgi:osmotically inducible protein OsmC